MPITSSTSSPISTQETADRLTYQVGFSFTAAAGQALEVIGSASTTVFVTRIVLELAASDTITVRKQSAASTGGTSSTPTIVPLDSDNAAVTGSVKTYTVAPTLGALVGNVAIITGSSLDLVFGDNSRQPLTLRGVAQTVGINLAAGTDVTGYIEFYEE